MSMTDEDVDRIAKRVWELKPGQDDDEDEQDRFDVCWEEVAKDYYKGKKWYHKWFDFLGGDEMRIQVAVLYYEKYGEHLTHTDINMREVKRRVEDELP